MAVVAVKDPASSGDWPATAPIGAIDYAYHSQVENRPVMTIPNAASKAPLPTEPRAVVPSTVIPVPTLPTVQNTAKSGRFEPVVRTTRAQEALAAATRFAKGTGAVDQTATTRITPPMPDAMSDDTEPNLSIGDRTKRGVALPPAARAVQLPSVKRRMARQG
jgi:hypothetical protein